MPQSFLNIPGLPLGLRNNNPGNLRPLSGGQKWQGEIEPDYTNNFSRFSDVSYGLRAMITDITGDIVNDGRNTIRKLVTAYAPPSENDTVAYIHNVSLATGLQPDQTIPVSEYWIRKIILAKLAVELGSQYAGKISSSDIDVAFSRLSDQVKQWMQYTGGASKGTAVSIFVILGAVAAWQFFKK